MKLKSYLALWTAKIAVIALKITRHRGTDFPGKVALKICPDFAAEIAKPEKIIGVTGTNGKTTTSNLIADALEKDGRKVLSNRIGSNCLEGVLTSLIKGVDLWGKCRYDLAVLEIDERSCRTIFPHIQPNWLVINNLTRDSVMRNAHPAYIAWVLTQFMPAKTKLILNADDLITVSTAPNNLRVFFGVEKMNTDLDHCINLINDMPICPKCHGKLSYDYVRYHHIGKAYCPTCGYHAPDYDYTAANVDSEALKMTISNGTEECGFPMITNGIHDIYNVTAAAAVLQEFGLSLEHTAELLRQVKIVPTRYGVSSPKAGYHVIRQMSKDVNAVATTRAFDHVSKQPGNKEIILTIFKSDDLRWSENISWMHDSDFEFLNQDNITNIVCTGLRWADYVLRLKMAGIPDEKISVAEKICDAPKALRLTGPEDIYILFGTGSIELSMTLEDAVCKEVIRRGGNDEN